ncbi:BgTH12-03786, partial [Blumeria graminis f. sp. triticale]
VKFSQTALPRRWLSGVNLVSLLWVKPKQLNSSCSHTGRRDIMRLPQGLFRGR